MQQQPSWLIAVATLALLASGARPRRKPRTPGARRLPAAKLSGAAGEPGRNGGENMPAAASRRGWADILRDIYERMLADRILLIAAGVAFYSLLALFPAITALVSLYGLFMDPATIVGHLRIMEPLLPPGAFDIVLNQVERIVARGGTGLTLTFAVSTAFAFWSANAAAKAIFEALTAICNGQETRGFLRYNLVTFAFTLGALAFFLLAVAAVIITPVALGLIGLSNQAGWLLSALRWPALLVALLLGLGLLYRFGPSRRTTHWQWLNAGSIFATLAWLAVSFAFSWYLSNFANYDAVYDSLGAVIGLMIWMWLSAVVVLVGAVLNVVLARPTGRI